MALKVKELRNDNKDELERKLEEIRQKYMDMRFNHVQGGVKNPLEMRSLRRDIAKLLTVIGEIKS